MPAVILPALIGALGDPSQRVQVRKAAEEKGEEEGRFFSRVDFLCGSDFFVHQRFFAVEIFLRGRERFFADRLVC